MLTRSAFAPLLSCVLGLFISTCASAVTYPVNTVQGLRDALNTSANGDTITVAAGTYNLGGTTLAIAKQLIVVGAGSGVTRLMADPSAFVAVHIQTSNVTLQGVAIEGAPWGLRIENPGGAQINTVTVRDIVINTAATQPGHGLFIGSATSVLADGVRVVTATANGAYVVNSDTVTLRGVTVQGTTGQHGIAVQTSNRVQVLNSSASTTLAPSNSIFFDRVTSGLIDGSVIPTAGANGIYIVGSSSITVRNTTVQQVSTQHGIAAQNSAGVYLVGNQVTAAAPGSNGILFINADSSVIDSCTIARATNNGILLDAGSDSNLVMNSTIQQTDIQHGIAVKLSNSNIVVGNTIRNIFFHGVQVIGGSGNRIERNVMTGHRQDGVVITAGDDPVGTRARYNYIGKNEIYSTGRAENRRDANGIPIGTGIWLNAESNGTAVFGNIESGAAEAGITSFNSSNNYILGNNVSGNAQAGVLLWQEQANLARPRYNYVHNNLLADQYANKDVLTRGTDFTDVARNFMVWNGAGRIGGGIGTENGSTQMQAYENTLLNLQMGYQIGPDSASISVFRNRLLNTPDNYAFTPAMDVRLDASAYVGGNFYSDHAAAGNPSGTTPYLQVIIDAPGARGRPYIDRHPYQSENLGRTTDVGILLPTAGQVMAAESKKTIEWRTRGCVYVDLFYGVGGQRTLIAANYPDMGFYHWTVPAATPADTYSIKIDCKNSAGVATGQTATSGAFKIGTADLKLMSPGQYLMLSGTAAVIPVAFTKSAAVGAVNVYLRNGFGARQLIQANVLDVNAVSVSGQSIIGATLRSNRMSIIIESVANANMSDSTDGFFSLRDTSGAFTDIALNQDFLVRETYEVNWISPIGSVLMDLELWDSDSKVFRPVAMNLPDLGRYTWFVPELFMQSGYLRATFRDSVGNIIQQVKSPDFNIKYTSATGAWQSYYRMYNELLQAHIYTTDANEYNVLGTRGWRQEGVFGQLLNGPRRISNVEARPYYRLYRAPFTRHFYTADRNEYFTLRQAPDLFVPEHIVGYLFPLQVAGTVPLYRLSHKFLPYHHWTTDANEYTVLGAAGAGWNQEGAAGYILPANAPSSNVQATPFVSSLMTPFDVASLQTDASGNGLSSNTPQAQAGAFGVGKPRIFALVNEATQQATEASAATVITIVGSGLGPQRAVGADGLSGEAAESLGGTTLRVNGQPATLLFASSSVIKAVLPNGLEDGADLTLVAEHNGIASAAFQTKVVSAAPGVFTADYSGKGQVAGVLADGSLNTADHPVACGTTALVYVTGMGRLQKQEETGQWVPVLPVTVQVGATTAEVTAARSAPGLPGVVEVQFRVPACETANLLTALTVRVGEAESQAGVTLAVAPQPQP